MEDFLAEWQRLLAWERDLQAESRELAERLGLAPPGLAADAAALSLADGPGPAEWRPGGKRQWKAGRQMGEKAARC